MLSTFIKAPLQLLQVAAASPTIAESLQIVLLEQLSSSNAVCILYIQCIGFLQLSTTLTHIGLTDEFVALTEALACETEENDFDLARRQDQRSLH